MAGALSLLFRKLDWKRLKLFTERLVSLEYLSWNLETHTTYTIAPITAAAGMTHQISAAKATLFPLAQLISACIPPSLLTQRAICCPSVGQLLPTASNCCPSVGQLLSNCCSTAGSSVRTPKKFSSIESLVWEEFSAPSGYLRE